MILNHQKFDFRNKCLIEKIVIQAPFRLNTVFQNEACFIYFLEGKAQIYSATEQASIETKESVLLKCGTYFADLVKNHAIEKYEILVFHLYPGILREIYADEIPSFIKPSPNKSFIHKIAAADILKKFVESLQFYFDHPGLVGDELLKLKIKELVLLLLHTKNADSIANLFADLFEPRSLNVKEIINNHLLSGLSIDDLAALSNLSVSTFNRTFQGLFNDTPANYIRMKRLEKARELLSVSSLTVSEIAFQTCFNDVAHFSRSFKEVYLCSPSSFRSSLKKS
jgi:AraC family transcriptional regulator, exoenzyme S synthesis regulatory protein ExsA